MPSATPPAAATFEQRFEAAEPRHREAVERRNPARAVGDVSTSWRHFEWRPAMQASATAMFSCARVRVPLEILLQPIGGGAGAAVPADARERLPERRVVRFVSGSRKAGRHRARVRSAAPSQTKAER
jgi:hypothetical protein